jgi:hypothetical protein
MTLPNQIKKEIDKETRWNRICDVIFFILNIILCQMQCLTQLYAPKQVISDAELFEAYKKVNKVL